MWRESNLSFKIWLISLIMSSGLSVLWCTMRLLLFPTLRYRGMGLLLCTHQTSTLLLHDVPSLFFTMKKSLTKLLPLKSLYNPCQPLHVGSFCCFNLKNKTWPGTSYFSLWTLFHCFYLVHFLYPFVGTTFRFLFPILAILNNLAVSTHMQIAL